MHKLLRFAILAVFWWRQKIIFLTPTDSCPFKQEPSFLICNSNFQTTITLTIPFYSQFYYPFEKDHLLPHIIKNHRKDFKIPQNIDLTLAQGFCIASTANEIFNLTRREKRFSGLINHALKEATIFMI